MLGKHVEGFGNIVREPRAGFVFKSIILLALVIFAAYGVGLIGYVAQ